MRCPQCGKEIDDVSAAQCPSCGMRLDDVRVMSKAERDSDAETELIPPPSGSLVAAAPEAFPVETSQPAGAALSALPQGLGISGHRELIRAEPQNVPLRYVQYPWVPPVQPTKPRRTGRIALIVTCAVIVTMFICAGTGIVLFSYARSSGLLPLHTLTTRSTPTTTSSTNPNAEPNVDASIVYQDSLTSSPLDWSEDSHCFSRSDGYHVKDGYICNAPVGSMSKVDVTVDVKQIAGETGWFYGIVFRLTGAGNYNSFVITSNGEWKATVHVNDQRTDLVPYVPNSAIRTGLNANNTLEVRAIGTHFDFFVNHTKVGEVDDATFSSGRVGIEGNPQGNVEVVYSNLTIAIPE